MKIKFWFLISFTISINMLVHTQNLRALFEQYNQKTSPGASVLVSKDGAVIFKESFGYADLEKEKKNESITNFRLASVTKQFTAAAVLILVQNGLIELKTNLCDVFEDFPDYGRKITIKNLLNHTSGLIDYEDLIPDTATVQVKDADVLKMMYKVDSTYFEPGTRFKYSNTGYALLAMIVEKISEKSFAQFLDENIFKPLGMISTVAHEEGKSVVENRAYGYERTDSGWIKKDQSITSAVLGDGGIYSNVEDLFKWEQSLYSNQILIDELRHESITREVLNDGEKIDYGFGWHLKTYKGVEIVYHGGSTQGFRNVIYRVPSKNFCIIILTNRNEGQPEKIADKIFEIYFEK